MCNETGIPEFLEFQIPGIPVRDPTQQDYINTLTLPIYKCHTRIKF